MGEVALPYVLAALVAVELVFNLLARTGYQTVRETAVSLLVTVPHVAQLAIVPVVWFVLYRELEPRIPGHLPHGWWIWPIGVVVMDLATYWMHRYHHALNLTWGVHSVHHSSEELTIATGGRSSLAEPLVNVLSGAYLFLVVPALIGLPVAAAGVGWLVKDTWGFAVHTRNVGRLGVLEHVLATPSHHRVHHALNPIYRGKNFGFVLIIWDKLFGTFQRELAEEPPVYGTVDAPRSYRPLVVALHELRQIGRAALATQRWWDKLRIWYMPAGWRPDDVVSRPSTTTRSSPPPVPLVLGGLHAAYFLAAMAHMMTSMGHAAADTAYVGFLLLGSVVSGELCEGSRRLVAFEVARAVVPIASIALTRTWFGRPLDASVAGLAVLGVANLVATLGALREVRAWSPQA